MLSPHILKPRLLFLLVAIVGLTSCGLPFGGGGLPGPLGDNTSKSPEDLLRASVDALSGTRTYHLTLDAGLLVFDLDVKKGVGVQGTVTVLGQAEDYVAVGGKVYHRGGLETSALKQLGRPADTWIVQSADKSSLNLTKNLKDYDFGQLYACIVSAHGKLSKGQQTVVADVEVQEVKDAGDVAGSFQGSYYIAKKNTAYPIQLVWKGQPRPGGNVPAACRIFDKASPTPTPNLAPTPLSTATRVTLTFSQFDHPVEIKAPANAIPDTQLNNLGGINFFQASPSPR